MKLSKTTLATAAALAGLLGGTAARAVASTQDTGTTKPKAKSKTTTPKVEKHACAGKNSCKGNGGCSTGDQGCKAKNSCKGKGGCATDASAKKKS